MKSLYNESWTSRFFVMLQAERDAAARNRIRHAALYDVEPGTESKDGVAVAGFDGHLFIGNGSNSWEQQFVGSTRLSDQGIGKWRMAFERRRAAAAEIGARYLHLAVPEKQCVLQAARWPGGAIKRVGPRPLDQLLSLGMPELVCPLNTLQDESWRAELAWRGDSHWCTSGVWFVFADLMMRLWPDRAFPFELMGLRRHWRKHDLASKFATTPAFEDVVALVRRAAVVSDNRLRARTGRQVGNQYVLGHPAAPHDECIVLFGSSHSFDMGLSDVLSTYFRRLHFIWDTAVDFDYCRRVGATLVISECAERYLIKPPRADVMPGEARAA